MDNLEKTNSLFEDPTEQKDYSEYVAIREIIEQAYAWDLKDEVIMTALKLKKENPEWGRLKCYEEALGEWVK